MKHLLILETATNGRIRSMTLAIPLWRTVRPDCIQAMTTSCVRSRSSKGKSRRFGRCCRSLPTSSRLSLPVCFCSNISRLASCFFLNCNPEATRLTGLEQEDSRGVELDEMWPNARGQGLTNAFLEAARTGKPFEAGKALYRNSRTERVFRVKAFSMPGERLGVAFLDLTAQERAEEANRKAEDARGTQREAETSDSTTRNGHVREDDSTIGRSEELARESGRLAAQEELAGHAARLLSHPTESVQESARRALARLESGYMSLVRPSLEQIQQAANEVASVVKQLRQFARVAPATGLSQCKTLDLSVVVSESADSVRSDVNGSDGKNVTPVLQELILGRDCYVKGEPSELLDVVNMLLKNALEATHPRGRVTVKTFLEEDCVVLEVRDDGAGIPEDDASRIFEPFGTSKSLHGGLGLAAVSGVIRRYGGDVRKSTHYGLGTTITVRLPRVDNP